jgi:acyl-CoA thioester hydrolase
MTRQPPDTREQYAHFIDITTRWMDNDSYAHVNNVVYYSFFDTAVNEYMIRAGVLDLRRGSVVCLAVDTACRFFRPLSFPDRVQCGLRVAHLGTSSVRFEIGVFREGDAEAAAQGHFVHVTCDPANQRPIPMPGDMREALGRLQMGREP